MKGFSSLSETGRIAFPFPFLPLLEGVLYMTQWVMHRWIAWTYIHSMPASLSRRCSIGWIEPSMREKTDCTTYCSLSPWGLGCCTLQGHETLRSDWGYIIIPLCLSSWLAILGKSAIWWSSHTMNHSLGRWTHRWVRKLTTVPVDYCQYNIELEN